MKGRGLMVAPVTAGFRTDLEALLAQFEKCGDPSFTAFQELFLRLKFGTIFCGRETEQEMRELVEKVLVLSLNYALEERDLIKRAGALMALCGLYYLQPKNCKCLIAVTLEKMLKLQEVMRDLEEMDLKDVLYCAVRLFRDQAFSVSVLSEEMNPLTSKAYDNPGDDLSATQLASQLAVRVDKDIVRRLAKDRAVETLDETHTEYVKNKARLPRKHVGSSLALVKDSLSVYLNRIADETEDKIFRRTNPHKTPTKEEGGGGSPVKRRREDLRRKAYHGLAKAARHRRHRQLSDRGGGIHTDPQELDLNALMGRPLDVNEEENGVAAPSGQTGKKRGRPKGSRNLSSGEKKKKKGPKRPKIEQGTEEEKEKAGTTRKRGRKAKPKAPSLSFEQALAAAEPTPRASRKPRSRPPKKEVKVKVKSGRGRRRLAEKVELEVVAQE